MRGARRAELVAVGLAAAAFLHLLFFREGTFVHGRDSMAASFMFDEPARVASGEVMYRDFFAYLGPGLIHLHAALIRVFGERTAPFGYMFLLIGVALTLTVYGLVARLVTSPLLRLLAPATFVVAVYGSREAGDHKWPALLLGLLAMLVLTGSDRGRDAFAAGGLLGAATLFTQDLAGGVAAGVVATLVADRGERRRLGALAAGAATSIVVGMGFFVIRAGLDTVLYDVVIFPLTRYHLIQTRYYVKHRPTDVSEAMRFVLGLAGLVAGLGALQPGRLFPAADDRTRRLLRVSAGAGLGLAASATHRYLDPTGIPFLGVLPVPLFALLDACCRDRGPTARRMTGLAAGLFAIGVGWSAVEQVLRVQRGPQWTRQTCRAGAVWLPQPSPELEWLEAHTRPGESVVFIPTSGGLQFLSRTRNATSFSALIDQHTPDQIAQAFSEIEARRPRHGLYRPDPPSPVAHGEQFFPPIERWLHQRYSERILPGGTRALTLREASGP